MIKSSIKKTAFLLLLFVFVLQQSKAWDMAVVNDFIKKPNMKHASIGIKVVEVSSGTVICSYNDQLSLCPASCLKLVSSAAALELLGPDFTYKTVLFTDGVVDSRGVLQGNIYIKGVGDPTLGSEFIDVEPEKFMNQWITDMEKSGIKSVNGKVIALDGLFAYEGVSSKWIWADIGNYYAPGIYGISIFDNMYRLTLKSGASGTSPEILGWVPAEVSLKFENNLKAAANDIDSAYIYGEPFSPKRRIFGTIPRNKPSFVIKGDIPDPGLFLASYFTRMLKKSGILVSGEASSGRIENIHPAEKKILSHTISPDLKEIIQVVNFRSNNHYAEHLFRKIGSEDKVTGFWKSKGLDTDGLFMYDGSGLSPVNAVSVDFLTSLLRYMAIKSKYAEVFYQSLPCAGKEGTVKGFLKDTSLGGNARVKSGSMGGVMSYSGYVARYGKKYAFSVIVNKYNGPQSTVRRQIEQLMVGLFDNP
ncbi:MAG: D-alanyl-D-alanine carboxypeptidase/D-alanyl-D-alanine-endopeptidase [Dysgonamonadaceae bacterium]|jgi:D-alanyl-D-alanine carboxypeptidase/D-alanyl-D-alanine-endopeptidase (penicillin-binding protein 4)|nr:D-alanyl-D-alanine carboxypeptidase/D-alanyl-D-alanine-endopeptidase [Dysgonamonadaceae bacterium]